MDVLGQQTEPHAASADNLSPIWWLFIVNQPKNGRLARSVPAYQANVLTGIYLQGYATQDILRAVRLVNF